MSFNGFDPNGIPEFVRARKAMQYANIIDDFARIMKDGNNGGYANNWLVADRKNNEVASLELGLKNVILKRTKDGFFVGSNFPADPKLIKEETDFDVNDGSSERKCPARALAAADASRTREKSTWRQDRNSWPITSTRSKARSILASGRCAGTSICRRVAWRLGRQPYCPCGAVQSKVTDAAGAERMTLTAALGHACGISYKASEHLAKHPEHAWMQPVLRDMPARSWTVFSAK